MPQRSSNISRANHDDYQSVFRGGDIDRSTFEQILEMDEDTVEREFSRSIVFDFFLQAEETFAKMDTYL